MSYKKVIFIAFVIVLIILMDKYRSEGFASQADKDKQIGNWLQANPEGSYASFKHDLDNVDIVDYESYKRKKK